MNKKYISYRLTLDDSLILKGIAICCMLWHHLFYEHPEFGNVVYHTAQIGKVCVSLFLFISGYGLTIQYGKIYNKPAYDTFKFQAKRYVKFYLNYWVVFVLFIPLGIFVFDIPYSGGILKFARDFMGVEGNDSYNMTWWFNKLIIFMYLLFPILYFLGRKNVVTLLLVTIAFCIIKIPIFFDEVHLYLLVFVLGIVFALKVTEIGNVLNKFNIYILLVVLLFSLLCLSYLRQCYILPYFNGMRMDSFICLCIVLLSVLCIRIIPLQFKMIKFLGIHSMNIYLIHTFIFYYFFPDLIYSFKYPILIFLALLGSSLMLSFIIELIKKGIRQPLLVEKVVDKINKSNL